ncbi:hypothetical protein RJ639_042193 [Escallonia herrerae]|uniref:adenylate kinase n=1 Tax=Escallonia herrerae TaxID=1293975 RepID=A0AA88WJA6_9ASTE|nr:hypothetical protein RJ639_042193 [Escallonia herrerae]
MPLYKSLMLTWISIPLCSFCNPFFILAGAPGSGKDTQCSKLAATYGFCHLSAGELLEKEAQSGSEYGALIKALKADGKLVPSEIVIKLLQQAREENEVKKFLINGFPHNKENRTAAEKFVGIPLFLKISILKSVVPRCKLTRSLYFFLSVQKR